MTLPVLFIGNKNYSSWSMRPWLVLKEAGIAFEERLVRLDSPETRAEIGKASPLNGKVPALMADGRLVWDSLAIAEWAAEQVPALWPAARPERAVARAASAQMHSGFAALRTALPMNLKRERALGAIPAAAAADIAQIEALWAHCRMNFGGSGPFLFGRYSIADAFFTPVATRFYSYQVALSPDSAAYVAALLGRESYREWRAGALAEAWANAETDTLG